MSNLPSSIIYTICTIYGLLVLSSIVVFIMSTTSNKDITELKQRIQSWWIMVIIFSVAILLSRNISISFFALISFLAFKEYTSLIPTRRADRRVLFWAYLAIPIQYLWVGYAWYGMFIIFVPVYMFLFMPMRMVLIGETKDFLRAAGTLHWGLMIMLFSISHLAFLLNLSSPNHPEVHGAGLVLFLVILTQLNDVCQFLWGKSFGKHKIIPKVSPNKTWEGFVGGICTTSILAAILSQWLTPFSIYMGLLAGFIIGISGFIGDVVISSLKRDLGVKDSGSLLPGHGGILDRIDSLTYTAPLFFHFTYYLYY